jgi:alkylation response protein AidB-like acyl-CoA dehydrogenase
MDLRYSDDDEAFREKLAVWLAREVPAHGAPPAANDWRARRAFDTAWQKKLYDAGYAGIHWPKEYGGQGAPLVRQLVYYEEVAKHRAPHIGVNFVGLQHGGPTLIAEGSPEQKAAHLPRILKGDEVWCQGFSEPNAGSDLASLRTRAVRDGDEYVVSGQKIWCSFANVADFCELLVRSDSSAPKHQGISWLILDVRSPGVEVRPLKTILGEGEFCEVFFNDVRVPVRNRVGAENEGWRVANVTLRFERGTSFAGWIVELGQFLDLIVKHFPNDVSEPEVGAMRAELDALWALVKLSVCEAGATGVPGTRASAIKLAYSELYQKVADLGVRALGRAALSQGNFEGLPNREIITKTMHSLSLTIAAGTSQIQKNIIAERILGLPKEPR